MDGWREDEEEVVDTEERMRMEEEEVVDTGGRVRRRKKKGG